MLAVRVTGPPEPCQYVGFPVVGLKEPYDADHCAKEGQLKPLPYWSRQKALNERPPKGLGSPLYEP